VSSTEPKLDPEPQRRILVVDDVEASRYTTARILRRAGFEVIEAATGGETLALADERIDLIVLDINLPDIDGYTVCRELRARQDMTNVPICYLSATFTASEDIAHGMTTGADSYLTHPADPVVLVATVRALLFAKDAHAEKRRADARFRTLFQLAPDGICLLTPQLEFSEVNPALTGQMGREPAALVGRPLREFILPEHQGSVAGIPGALDRDGRWSGVLRLIRPDGATMDTQWQIVPDTGSALRIAMVTDVTARLKVETIREHVLLGEQAARAEAERSNLLKDEFLATLSHELRNPLNAILGWAEVLKRSGNVPRELALGIDAIERNSRVQSHLISDLLDFAGIRFGKMRMEQKALDPNQTLRAVVDVVAAQADAHRVQLVLETPLHPVTVFADEARLHQVFWNLLTNAIKFTPAGGRVDVTTRVVDSTFEVGIRDTGRGISAEFLPRLFDRFSQQDSGSAKAFAGLGIGLTIVRHLVTMHGGTVSATSEGVGRGACFTVRLPLAAEGSAVRSQPRSRADLSGIRVLLVEDLVDTRALIVRVLTDAGARVREAANAAQALRLIAEESPDVLISDIGMPGTDGYQLIRTLRGEGYSSERLPAIALTAFVRSEDETDAREAGFQLHLSKPVNADLLIAALAELARAPATR